MDKQRNKHVLPSIRGAFSIVAGMLLFASCESGRFADILASADKIGELPKKFPLELKETYLEVCKQIDVK